MARVRENAFSAEKLIRNPNADIAADRSMPTHSGGPEMSTLAQTGHAVQH